MSQLARALMTAADEALDATLEQLEVDQLRARQRRSNAREGRRELRTLPNRTALIGNTIAPGVPVSAYMIKVLGADPVSVLALG